MSLFETENGEPIIAFVEQLSKEAMDEVKPEKLKEVITTIVELTLPVIHDYQKTMDFVVKDNESISEDEILSEEDEEEAQFTDEDEEYNESHESDSETEEESGDGPM